MTNVPPSDVRLRPQRREDAGTAGGRGALAFARERRS